MKLTLRVQNQATPNQDQMDGTVEAKLMRSTTLEDCKRLWEAERTLNELTDLRVHLNLIPEEGD